MRKKISIIIEDDNDKKIMEFQVKMMKKTKKSYSYGKAVNYFIKNSSK